MVVNFSNEEVSNTKLIFSPSAGWRIVILNSVFRDFKRRQRREDSFVHSLKLAPSSTGHIKRGQFCRSKISIRWVIKPDGSAVIVSAAKSLSPALK